MLKSMIDRSVAPEGHLTWWDDTNVCTLREMQNAQRKKLKGVIGTYQSV